jgi:hypothetical protein
MTRKGEIDWNAILVIGVLVVALAAAAILTFMR